MVEQECVRCGKLHFIHLHLRYSGKGGDFIIFFFVIPYPMFNVSGLSLRSPLTHPLFHTTIMDREIFYRHYHPGCKPGNPNCGQAVRVIHHRPAITHSVVSSEGRLLSSFSKI